MSASPGALVRYPPVKARSGALVHYPPVVVIEVEWHARRPRANGPVFCVWQSFGTAQLVWVAEPHEGWEVIGNIHGDVLRAFEACVMAREYDAATRLATDDYRARGLL